MSEIDRITEIKDRAGTGSPNFTNGVNFAGSDSGISPHTHTESANEPSSPSNGDTWWDSDNDIYKVYMDNAWKDWLGTTAPATIAWGGTRHVYASYNSANSLNTIEYFSSVANVGATAADFGDLTVARVLSASTSSTTRGLFIGSVSQSSTPSNGNVIDYITIATTGNATDFGNLNFSEQSGSYVLEAMNAAGNGTRGIIFGGYSSWSGNKNNIEYVTIANTGNGTDFGDLSSADRMGAACADATRAVYAYGENHSTNAIDYVTIDTTGNATSFGTQAVAHSQTFAGCSDATRGLFSGGINSSYAKINSISYITIQTAGNSADFGDMAGGRRDHGSTSDATYGTFIGGRNDGNLGASTDHTVNIERVTIQTLGNATDFADAAVAVRYGAACSGAPS